MKEQHPNLKLIHLFFHAYGNKQPDAVRQIASPDIEWKIPGRRPFSRTKKEA